MVQVTPMTPAAYRRERWRNDGGWTTEIVRGGDADFDWRASIADIETDGPFSPFPGIDRTLLLLGGNGIELDIDGVAKKLTKRFDQLRFPGEAAVHCRLLAGPTRDFNVMVRRGAVQAQVVARPIVGSMLVFPQADTEWLVYVHAGSLKARVEDSVHAAGAHDCLHVRFASSPAPRLLLEGSGELVLVRLSFSPGTGRD